LPYERSGSPERPRGNSSRAIAVVGQPSQAILDPLSTIQNMYLDDAYKGREAFSKIKSILRKVRARTREALVEAMGQAISSVSARDIRGLFEHCGYRAAVPSL
jgi:hypothetical protein